MLDLIRIFMLLGIGILVGAMLMNNREALDALKADVAANHSAVESAIVLINGLVNRLTDALASASGDDLVAEIQGIRDDLTESSVELGNSVAQNTASEGDSTSFPPQPATGDGSSSVDSGAAGSGDASSPTPTTDVGPSDGASASSGDSPATQDTPSDAAVDDTSAGADQETAAAADQVPPDVGESLPDAGEVFPAAGDAPADPGNSNNPDETPSSTSDDGQPSA
jgi:hypothetical protein